MTEEQHIILRPKERVQTWTKIKVEKTKYEWKETDKILIILPKIPSIEKNNCARIARGSFILRVGGKKQTPTKNISPLKNGIPYIITKKQLFEEECVIEGKWTSIETKLVNKKEKIERGWEAMQEIEKKTQLTTEENQYYTMDDMGDKETQMIELKTQGLLKKETEPLIDYIKRFQKKMNATIKYDIGGDIKENEGKPPSYSWKSKVAQCGTYAANMVAAMRAQGIAARVNGGEANKIPTENNKKEEYPNWSRGYYHCKAEIFIPGIGWVPIEPQGRDLNDDGAFIGWTIDTHRYQDELHDLTAIKRVIGSLEQQIALSFYAYDVENKGALTIDTTLELIKSLRGYDFRLNKNDIYKPLLIKMEKEKPQEITLQEILRGIETLKPLKTTLCRMSSGQQMCQVYYYTTQYGETPMRAIVGSEYGEKTHELLGHEVKTNYMEIEQPAVTLINQKKPMVKSFTTKTAAEELNKIKRGILSKQSVEQVNVEIKRLEQKSREQLVKRATNIMKAGLNVFPLYETRVYKKNTTTTQQLINEKLKDVLGEKLFNIFKEKGAIWDHLNHVEAFIHGVHYHTIQIHFKGLYSFSGITMYGRFAIVGEKIHGALLSSEAEAYPTHLPHQIPLPVLRKVDNIPKFLKKEQTEAAQAAINYLPHIYRGDASPDEAKKSWEGRITPQLIEALINGTFQQFSFKKLTGFISQIENDHMLINYHGEAPQSEISGQLGINYQGMIIALTLYFDGTKIEKSQDSSQILKAK